MLLEFFLELIRGGPELSTELLHWTKSSLRNFLAFAIITAHRAASRHFLNAQQATKAAI